MMWHTRWLRHLVLMLGALLFGLWHLNAHAHKPSDSYLTVSVQNAPQKNSAQVSIAPVIDSQWDIALRDLDYAIGLDDNANSEITWQEVLTKQKAIFAYALARLSIKNNQQDCTLAPSRLLIDNHTDGAYAVIQFSVNCKKEGVLISKQGIGQLSFHYTLFSDIDPSHRGLLKLSYLNPEYETSVENSAATIKLTKTAIFGPDSPRHSFTLSAPNRFNEFKEYVVEGIWHIWIGFDHILFLISLLLPAVLVYSAKTWQPTKQFKTAFIDVLKVVTAFTIAHSITLTLATLQIIELPSRWVEAAIAASVILAALNNLFPYLLKRRWLAAFVFGLIHGFGFAAVLADLGLQQGALVVALIGFNVGVEIGQIAILSLFIPTAYALRQSWFYKHIIFYGGSIIIAIIASLWFAERAFNITVFSDMPALLGFS